MFCFYFIHSETEKNSYQVFLIFTKKCLPEQGVQDFVNINKIKFELFDQICSKFNETKINHQVTHSNTEYDETPGAKYPNENNSEDTETNTISPVLNCMRKIQVHEIAESINYSNSKQKEVFGMNHTWSKDYVKCIGYNIELGLETRVSVLGPAGKSAVNRGNSLKKSY